MPDGGELLIDVQHQCSNLSFSVIDNGKGFSEEAIRRASEPFFSTKSTGTGLGLAIVYRIVEVHRGQVILENMPIRGAKVTIMFPIHTGKTS
jgi:signal transduction histidine kinase